MFMFGHWNSGELHAKMHFNQVVYLSTINLWNDYLYLFLQISLPFFCILYAKFAVRSYAFSSRAVMRIKFVLCYVCRVCHLAFWCVCALSVCLWCGHISISIKKKSDTAVCVPFFFFFSIYFHLHLASNQSDSIPRWE